VRETVTETTRVAVPSADRLRRLGVITAEVATLCLFAAALLAVHQLVPADVQASLVLSHTDPQTPTLWTTHAVHATRSHALDNAIGFLLASVPALAVARRLGRRQFFWTALLVGLAVLPVPLSVSSILWYRVASPLTVGSSLGASGLVGSVAGLLSVVTVVGWQQYGGRRATAAGSLTVVGVAAVAVVAEVSVTTLLPVVAVGGVAVVAGAAWRGVSGPRLATQAALVAATAALPTVARALLPGSPLGPSGPSPAVVAVHALGVGWGIVWAVGLLVVLTVLDEGRTVRGLLTHGLEQQSAETVDTPTDADDTVEHPPAGELSVAVWFVHRFRWHRLRRRPPVGAQPPYTPLPPEAVWRQAEPCRRRPPLPRCGAGVRRDGRLWGVTPGSGVDTPACRRATRVEITNSTGGVVVSVPTLDRKRTGETPVLSGKQRTTRDTRPEQGDALGGRPPETERGQVGIETPTVFVATMRTVATTPEAPIDTPIRVTTGGRTGWRTDSRSSVRPTRGRTRQRSSRSVCLARWQRRELSACDSLRVRSQCRVCLGFRHNAD
jgi:hypothetical protein